MTENRRMNDCGRREVQKDQDGWKMARIAARGAGLMSDSMREVTMKGLTTETGRLTSKRGASSAPSKLNREDEATAMN